MALTKKQYQAAGKHKMGALNYIGRGYYAAIGAAKEAAGPGYSIVSAFDDDGVHYFSAKDTSGMNAVGATGVGEGIAGGGGGGGQVDDWMDTAQTYATDNKWVLLAAAAGAAYFLWKKK